MDSDSPNPKEAIVEVPSLPEVTQESPPVGNTPIATQASVPALDPKQWFISDTTKISDNKAKLKMVYANIYKNKKILVLVIVAGIILLGGSAYGLVAMNRKSKVNEPVDTTSSFSSSSDNTQATAPTQDTTTQSPSTPAANTTTSATSNTTKASSDAKTSSSPGTPTTTTPTSTSAPTSTAKTYVMTYTFKGCYVSVDQTIKAGDTIRFENKDATKYMSPASNDHPDHKLYEEFDAGSPGIPPGGSYSFTFNKKGLWGYHDHLKSSCGGTITVQ